VGLRVRRWPEGATDSSRVRTGPSRSRVGGVVFWFVILSGRVGDVWAQDLSPLVTQCASGGSPQLLTVCRSMVLTAQAIRGGIALADRSGADLSGASSTLGKRLGSAPRVSVDLRLRGSRFATPDVLGGGTGVAAENSVNAFGLTGSVALGLLDGFALMPTVGGVFSLDLLASGSVFFLDESDGFLGDEGILSVGGRLGVFRESFTLPGVTVSAVHSFGQRVGWTGAADGPAIDTEISTTSVRATTGKNFFTFAVLGGVGWDWDRGELGVEVPDPATPGVLGTALMGGLTTRRTVYFAGASITRLVFQISVEGGWSGGYDGLPGYMGAYDPAGNSPFVSVAGRLTI
jgi:hypothetical protein